MTGANDTAADRPDPPADTQTRVLVVDDEASLADLLVLALSAEGWEVRSAGNGAQALRIAGTFRPDAVVLDMLLPDLDGLAVLRALRGERQDLPVLLLTAQDSAEDRAAGLAAGASGYLTKPFRLGEVVARVRASLRRPGGGGTGPASEGPVLIAGDLSMDEARHEVRRGGRPLALTGLEYQLLRCLLRHQDRALSASEILTEVWHTDFGGRTNLVDLSMAALSRKIGNGGGPVIKVPSQGGFRLAPAQATAPAPRPAARRDPMP